MRRISFLSSSLALGLLLAAASPPAAHAQREVRGKTYTVMTYNIGGKPGFTGYALDNGSSCEERSRQIGQHILDMPAADQPDIVVFAEATGDCYKEGLTKTLNENGPYKSFVFEFVGGSAQLQDSGLMFFSKFPWTLPDMQNGCPEPRLDGEQVNPVGQPTFGRAVGTFQSYSDLAFSDRMMEKGIGYACVVNPSTRQPINVFLTHNQANYWNPIDDDWTDFAHDEREVNMKEASDFIEAHAPFWRTDKTGEAVLFMGDMNTFGDDVEYWVNQKDEATLERVILPQDVVFFREYADLIAPGGILDSKNHLRDPWRTEGTDGPGPHAFDAWGQAGQNLGFVYDAPEVNAIDMGFTWDALRNGQTDGDQSRARLDYILDRQVKFNGVDDCFMHTTVERGFLYRPNGAEVEPGYVDMDLSDHYPLRALIGPKEAQCSPRAALVDKLTPTSVTVTNGGAKKWFRYTQPGTYVIDAETSAALDVHVYAASDLSTDLLAKEGDGAIGPGTFVGRERQNDPGTFKTDGPFYVMVSYASRTQTGTFTLSIRKNNCSTWNQAEWLDPFEAIHMAMSGPPIGTAQTRCYFKIRQDQAPADVFDADVKALAAKMKNADQSAATAALSLYKADHSPILAGIPSASSTALATTLPQSDAIVFLVLERPAATQQMGFDIVWTRNITTIDVKKLTVVNQDDDNDGDEVAIFWSIDDGGANLWPVDEDSGTANGADPTMMTWFYGELASGASSKTPVLITCGTFCPLASQFADAHHVNIAFPDAMWGFAWEIDTDSDDPLFHEPAGAGHDGRFIIRALDPSPSLWIVPGTAITSHVFKKNLWADFLTYSHGYRLEATRNVK